MSLNVNQVFIGGNLTRDPELKTVANGKSVCKFSIAINDKYKAGDGTMKETVTFVDVEAWNGTAEMVAKYLRKGSSCLVEGRLKSDSWQTQAGEKRQKLLVKGERVHFTGAPPSRNAAEVAGEEMAAPQRAVPVATDDEPPF